MGQTILALVVGGVGVGLARAVATHYGLKFLRRRDKEKEDE